MISLYQMLQKIKQRPGMYIGSPSVSDLFMFLCGYKIACQNMGLPLSEEEHEFHEFQPWLQTKFRLTTSASWAKIIMLYSSNETHAFEMFFELFEEFLSDRHQIYDVEEKLEEKPVAKSSVL